MAANSCLTLGKWLLIQECQNKKNVPKLNSIIKKKKKMTIHSDTTGHFYKCKRSVTKLLAILQKAYKTVINYVC